MRTTENLSLMTTVLATSDGYRIGWVADPKVLKTEDGTFNKLYARWFAHSRVIGSLEAAIAEAELRAARLYCSSRGETVPDEVVVAVVTVRESFPRVLPAPGMIH